MCTLWKKICSLRHRHNLTSARLVTSAKQRQDPCSGPQRIQRITGSAFQISLHPDWQVDNGIFNRPIMTRTQILVHRPGAQNKDFGAV